MISSNKELKDFIYLDTDRVRSFVAQLYEGVPEAFGATTGHEKAGKGEAAIEVPLLGKLGIEGNILYQKGSSETRSAHHYLYNLFEQKIKEFGKLREITDSFPREQWQADEFKDGTFLLVQCRIQIIDYRAVVNTFEIIPRIAELSSIFNKQSLRQQLEEGKIDQREYDKQLKLHEVPTIIRKDIPKIGEMVEKLYSGTSRVKAYPFLDEERYYFVGNAAR